MAPQEAWMLCPLAPNALASNGAELTCKPSSHLHLPSTACPQNALSVPTDLCNSVYLLKATDCARLIQHVIDRPFQQGSPQIVAHDGFAKVKDAGAMHHCSGATCHVYPVDMSAVEPCEESVVQPSEMTKGYCIQGGEGAEGGGGRIMSSIA